MHRYLVVSDLHLADVEDHEDGWKYYKASRFVVDDELAELLQLFTREAGDDERLTLILNGDVFDFDLVTGAPDDESFRVSRIERRRCLHATAERSCWKLERILADHPVFLDALADFLAGGHEVVYVMGNHDREFHFAEVQDRLVRSIRRAGQGLGHPVDGWSIRFEPWFYYVPGEIWAEHGQQYDYYTSFRYILSPTVLYGREERIATPMGNLSNRYLMTRMGYFNPHASDYILNLFSYIGHWLRYYAFSRRSLAVIWFFGSLAVLARLLRTKKKLRRPPEGYEEQMQRLAERFELTDEQMRDLRGLQRRPITHRLFRLIREFWIDRVLISLVMIGGTVTLALVPIPLWIKLMVPLSTFPLAYLIYEQLVRGGNIFTVEQEIPRCAQRIARVAQVPLVTFGHTHVPRLLPLEAGITFVDTGTWAPITRGGRRDELEPGFRNYLIVCCENGVQQLTLGSWPIQAEVSPPKIINNHKGMA